MNSPSRWPNYSPSPDLTVATSDTSDFAASPFDVAIQSPPTSVYEQLPAAADELDGVLNSLMSQNGLDIWLSETSRLLGLR